MEPHWKKGKKQRTINQTKFENQIRHRKREKERERETHTHTQKGRETRAASMDLWRKPDKDAQCEVMNRRRGRRVRCVFHTRIYQTRPLISMKCADVCLRVG